MFRGLFPKIYEHVYYEYPGVIKSNKILTWNYLHFKSISKKNYGFDHKGPVKDKWNEISFKDFFSEMKKLMKFSIGRIK